MESESTYGNLGLGHSGFLFIWLWRDRTVNFYCRRGCSFSVLFKHCKLHAHMHVTRPRQKEKLEPYHQSIRIRHHDYKGIAGAARRGASSSRHGKHPIRTVRIYGIDYCGRNRNRSSQLILISDKASAAGFFDFPECFLYFVCRGYHETHRVASSCSFPHPVDSDRSQLAFNCTCTQS